MTDVVVLKTKPSTITINKKMKKTEVCLAKEYMFLDTVQKICYWAVTFPHS